MLPFTETFLENTTYLRTFYENVESGDMTWHRDREDRVIEPTHNTDWTFQIDNQLPQKIDKQIFIPKGVYHRLIKGNGDLILKVSKFK